MHFCQFRAGEIVLSVETPEKLDIKEPYSFFVCENEKSDLSVRFCYINEINEVTGHIITDTDTVVVSKESENLYFYYRVTGDNKFYALRKVNKNDLTKHEIFIPEEYRGMIWTRLVFSLINFDDVAAQFDSAVFHASFIEYNGEAILFTAPCGTGKSTQASLWEKYKDAQIINGDKALLFEKNGLFFASGLPFSGSSQICKNKILPVKAIIRLGQATENKTAVLTGVKAYKAVLEGCYHSVWSSVYDTKTSLIAEKIATSIPVYSLDCLPDKTAVDALYNVLY